MNTQLAIVNGRLKVANEQLGSLNSALTSKIDELEIAKSALDAANSQLSDATAKLAQASKKAKDDLITLARTDPSLRKELESVIDSLNTPPRVTRQLADLEIFDRSQKTAIDLHDYFDDNEDTVAGLSFAVSVSPKNNTSIRSAIATESGILSILYTSDASKHVTVNVTATDSGGKSTPASFEVAFLDIRLDLNGANAQGLRQRR